MEKGFIVDAAWYGVKHVIKLYLLSFLAVLMAWQAYRYLLDGDQFVALILFAGVIAHIISVIQHGILKVLLGVVK